MASKVKERTLEETSTWAVAVVCFVLLFISIVLEQSIHKLGTWLKKKHKKALFEALEKIKAELMLLGFISLLLTIGQTPISSICIPKNVASTMHPCSAAEEKRKYGKKDTGNKDDDGEKSGRRLLLELAESYIPRRSLATKGYDKCALEGKVAFVSAYGVHQLHIFIFVIAVVHVIYCIVTYALVKTEEDLMALPVKLPWELEEDILSRLPPRSLVRFRSLCKKWNSLFTDKSFLNNHLSRSRPQFIFLTNSKIYSIDIINHNSDDPTIKLHELPSSDIPNRDTLMNFTTITTCDDLLFYDYWCWESKTALWNPWLRQVRWIQFENKQLYVFGLGYDNSRPEKVYKILGYFVCHSKVWRDEDQRVAIYDCASHKLKFIDKPKEYWPITEIAKKSNVSLNGNLYWFACNFENHEFFIRIFDFSRESFKPFCLLPCQKNHHMDELILAVYKGERFSLLKQSCLTREIGIWITKNRIGDDGESVVWIKLMALSTTELPQLFNKVYRISYFIYEKTLFMCCGNNESGVACIYIVKEDLCKKIQVDSGTHKCCHCVYTPNLISVP